MHDHHIPLRPAELIRKLGDEPSVTIFEREQFRAFCELIEATIHHEYRGRLARITAAYAPFDPDCETLESKQLADFIKTFPGCIIQCGTEHLMFEFSVDL